MNSHNPRNDRLSEAFDRSGDETIGDLPIGGVGGRVAEERKLAGLTQQQLASRAHVSVSLVSKVERGLVPASPAFIAAVARALRLVVTDLTDRPRTKGPRSGSEHAMLPELERAIIERDDHVPEGPAPGLDKMAVRLAGVVEAGRRSRYSSVLNVLPDLLRHLHVHTGSIAASCEADQELAHRLLAQAYQCAMFAAYKFGALSLAAWASERMDHAADRSGDLLWAVMGQYGRAQALMFSGSYTASSVLLDRAAGELDDATEPRALEVRGAIHLSSAIIAARTDKRRQADHHLDEARDLARHIRPGDPFDTAFSPANVDIHAVAAAIEATDYTTALSRAQHLDLGRLKASLYPSRLGHYHIDLGRAWLLHGDDGRCVAEIQNARQVSPQQARYHPQVHETLRALARGHRRTDPVTRLAAWAGLRDAL